MIRSGKVFVPLVALVLLVSQTANACPFCSAVSQTFSEEIESMDAVVIAKLVEPPPPASDDNAGDFVKAKFQVSEIIKGHALLTDTC